VSQCLRFANITIRHCKHGCKKEEKRQEKKKKKEKGKFLRTVIVRAIEAFEVKEGICMHAKYQSDKQNTHNYCSCGGHYCAR
jgi:hypothetical protein